LVDGVESTVQNEIGQCPVLAVGATRAEETLAQPGLQNLTYDACAISGKRSGAAVNGAVSRLHTAQEVERKNVTHVQHPGNESLVPIKCGDLSGNGANARVAEGPGHCEQRAGVDDAVRIDRDQDIAAGGRERIRLRASAIRDRF